MYLICLVGGGVRLNCCAFCGILSVKVLQDFQTEIFILLQFEINVQLGDFQGFSVRQTQTKRAPLRPSGNGRRVKCVSTCVSVCVCVYVSEFV